MKLIFEIIKDILPLLISLLLALLGSIAIYYLAPWISELIPYNSDFISIGLCLLSFFLTLVRASEFINDTRILLVRLKDHDIHISEKQDKCQGSASTLIQLSKLAFPEDFVGNLIAVQQRMIKRGYSPWLIRKKMFQYLVELFLDHYFQIQLENLWLPKSKPEKTED